MHTLAFVGCAHIHTPGFINMIRKRDDVKVARVWDPDPRRASFRAAELGATVAESADAIFSDASTPSIVICSETNRHETLVSAGAAAKKNLFVEKPLGMASADAIKMAEQIEKAGVIFQTGYFQRSEPRIRLIKDLITSGKLGQITRVRGSNCHSGALGNWFGAKPDKFHEDWNWMANPAIAGCGAFGDLGTHSLDIVLWWMGDVASVTAQIDFVTKTYPNCDESGEGMMRFKSGAIGTIAAGWVDRDNPVRYFVSGTEGHAAIINNQLHLISTKEKTFDASQPVRNSELPAPAPHAFELYLDALVGKPLAIPLVTPREAAYRNTVMQAMYAGAAQSKWVSLS